MRTDSFASSSVSHSNRSSIRVLPGVCVLQILLHSR